MSRAHKMIEGPRALDLIEETFHCLRRTPARIWLIYYTGALPFVLALLFFWADMSRSPFARERLGGAALLMTFLFLFMKVCQCKFTAELNASLCGRPCPRWRLRDWLGVALRQSIWQPFGLFLLPVALILFAPFGWTYAFFQNLTVLDKPSSAPGTRSLFQRAWRQTMLWPGQNHAALLALKGFALFVFVDLVIAALAVPQFLKILLGVETSFTRVMGDPTALVLTVFNTTFLSVIAGLTYLCVDPFLKTLYVLRCFYGESLRTGQDLQAELGHFRVAPALATLLLLLSIASPSARAAEGQPPPPAAAQIETEQLNQTMGEVLSGRQYQWRLPRMTEQSESEKGFLGLVMDEISTLFKDALKSLGGWVQKALNWMTQGRTGGGGGGSSSGWYMAMRILLIALGGVLIFFLILLLVRTWRQHLSTAEVQAEPVQTAPDLEDDNVAADQLPEDGWLELARQLIASGDFRLALRALYLSSLAHLASRQFLTIAKFKSNFDYLRELQRRGHVMPDLIRLFGDNVMVFDRVWYGLHQVDSTLLNQFSTNVDNIRRVA